MGRGNSGLFINRSGEPLEKSCSLENGQAFPSLLLPLVAGGRSRSHADDGWSVLLVTVAVDDAVEV